MPDVVFTWPSCWSHPKQAFLHSNWLLPEPSAALSWASSFPCCRVDYCPYPFDDILTVWRGLHEMCCIPQVASTRATSGRIIHKTRTAQAHCYTTNRAFPGPYSVQRHLSETIGGLMQTEKLIYRPRHRLAKYCVIKRRQSGWGL